jgi:competence protein ComGC
MKKRAFSLVEVTLVCVILVILYFILPVFLSKPRTPKEVYKRNACASNLKQIYTAMILYSHDYIGEFPMIDLKEGQIVGEDAVEANQLPQSVENAFKDIPASAGRSISQNLWLTIRAEFAQPEIFFCPNSKQAGQKCYLRDTKDTAGGVGAEYFIDFPFEKKGMTISYSFVQPWTIFDENKSSKSCFWSTDIDPRLVIGADANNGSQPNYEGKPLSDEELKKYINSTNHNDYRSGQNVVYGDGHVTFERSAYVGMNNDNIYTAQPNDFNGPPDQTPGILSVKPKNEFDSVLVPNRESDLLKWDRKP